MKYYLEILVGLAVFVLVLIMTLQVRLLEVITGRSTEEIWREHGREFVD